MFAVKVDHEHNQVNSGPIHIGGQREGLCQVAEKQEIAGLNTYPHHNDCSHAARHREEAVKSSSPIHLKQDFSGKHRDRAELVPSR